MSTPDIIVAVIAWVQLALIANFTIRRLILGDQRWGIANGLVIPVLWFILIETLYGIQNQSIFAMMFGVWK